MIRALLLLAFALPAFAQTYTCQQASSSGGFTLSCSGVGQPPPPPPLPPVDVPQPPSGTVPLGGIDCSDTAPRIVNFNAGAPQLFQFTTPGGMVDVTLVTVSGSFARRVIDSGPGFTDRVTNPIGSDFRHKAIQQPLPAGTYGYQVTLDRTGRFMLQCLV